MFSHILHVQYKEYWTTHYTGHRRTRVFSEFFNWLLAISNYNFNTSCLSLITDCQSYSIFLGLSPVSPSKQTALTTVVQRGPGITNGFLYQGFSEVSES